MPAMPSGSKAPDFTLTAHDGKSVRLYDVLEDGWRVILTFHPASFTGG